MISMEMEEEDGIEFFEHCLVTTSKTESICEVCKVTENAIFFECVYCKKNVHFNCVGSWACEKCSSKLNEEKETSIEISEKSGKMGRKSFLFKKKEKQKEFSPEKLTKSTTEISLRSLSLEGTWQRISSSQSLVERKFFDDQPQNNQQKLQKPTATLLGSSRKLNLDRILNDTAVKVAAENGIIDISLFDELLNYKQMMEKKENLLKRKEEIKEMSKKIINEIGISLDDRSKSSIELCKVINLFLNAINKNSISLRSTLKKIEEMYMCLVRQEQIKSPFLGSVEIPAKMWIDTDDPETLEHIYSLRTVITRVERFLRLKDALRYEKSLLEKDLQAIDNLNQFITSLLSISKNAQQQGISRLQEGKKMIEGITMIIDHLSSTANEIYADDLWKNSPSISHLILDPSLDTSFSQHNYYMDNWNEPNMEDRSQIRFSGEGEVTEASVAKLVELLSFEKFSQEGYKEKFFLVYKSFMTNVQLLEKLILRYCISPPPIESISEIDCISIKESRQIPIRLRVLHIIKYWIENFEDDFKESEEMIFILSHFAKNTVNKTAHSFYSSLFLHLIATLLKKKNTKEEIELKKENFPTTPPTPEIPPLINFANLSPTEISRQITLMDEKLFKKIQTNELIPKNSNENYQSKSSYDHSPNLFAFLNRYKNISLWVVREILSESNYEIRSFIIRKFIDVLCCLSLINNYHAKYAILDGLNNRAILRMRKTWEAVGERYYELFTTANKTAEKGYKGYKEHLNYCLIPCIPHIELWKNEILLIQKSSIDIEGLVNFSKLKKVAEIIKKMKEYQKSIYCYYSSLHIQKYILDQIEVDFTLNNDDYYELSLTLESKEIAASVEAKWLQ